MGGDESLEPQPNPKEPPLLIIVARDQADLWECLMRHIVGDEGVQIILDRRKRERRRRSQTGGPDRRKGDRRESPSIEHDLRHRSVLIVRQSARVALSEAAPSKSSRSR